MATQWYHRSGSPFEGGRKLHPVTEHSAYYLQPRPCGRCGGQGGSQAWAHTGWTCYACGGDRFIGQEKVKVYTAEKLAKLNAAKAKADAKRAAEHARKMEEEAARIERERAGNIEQFARRYPVLWPAMKEAAKGNDFLRAMVNHVEANGSLTENQEGAVVRTLDGIEARKAEDARRAGSAWVGNVGERIELEITTKKIITLESTQYPPVWRGLFLCADADGNSIKYIGNAACMPNEGETALLKVGIKAHDEYKGERQTVIQRPALVKSAPQEGAEFKDENIQSRVG